MRQVPRGKMREIGGICELYRTAALVLARIWLEGNPLAEG
jgi:hypothetical protein